MLRRPTPSRLASLHVRWLAILVAATTGLAGAWMYQAHRGSEEIGPDPNGLDDLIRAGASIRGDWPNRGQIAEADPVELRAFVDANRAALDLARVGLARECLVVFENSEEGLASQAGQHRRLIFLCRLLAADGFAAEAEGQVGHAWRSDVDVLRVGQAGSQGGILAHASMCWTIQDFALRRIRKRKDRLGADECRAIIAALADLDRRRVDPDALVRRWDDWVTNSWSLPYRTLLWFNGAYGAEERNQAALARAAADKIARSFRLLMAELAIRAYTLDRKRAPGSLDELVPAYLEKVPIDPATSKPIDYPKTQDGRLADDPGSVRPEG